MISHRLISRARSTLGRLALAALFVAFLAGCSSDDADVAVEDVGDQVAEELDEAAEDATDVVEEAANTSEEDAEEMVDEAAEEVDAAAEDAAAAIDERSAAIAQVLRDNDLESLASAVEQVDATELLGDGEFTFFAPNDAAFLELDADQLADLLSNPAELTAVLQNHVVTDLIDSSALGGLTEVEMESGNTVTVTVSGDTIMVGDATVVNPDVDAADGVIHVVDSVLLP